MPSDACGVVHLLLQAEWSHIGPHFFNVSETFRLGSTHRCVAPATWIRALSRPDGVLLLVIHHHFISCTFCIVVVHCESFTNSLGSSILSAERSRLRCTCSMHAAIFTARVSTFGL